MDRVRSLQDKSQEDIKRLEKAVSAANSAADKRAKYVDDEDDLKIVEQPRTCIEIINSDDENEEPAATVTKTPVLPTITNAPTNPSELRKLPSPYPRVVITSLPKVVSTMPSLSSIRPILISSVRSESNPSEIHDISDSDKDHELPLPPEVVMEEPPSTNKSNKQIPPPESNSEDLNEIQNISDDENELPLPPEIINNTAEPIADSVPTSSNCNINIDIANDKKLKQRPHVIIQRIEDIHPLGKIKLDQLMSKIQERVATKQLAELTKRNYIKRRNTDDLVELIEVDEDDNDNDVVCCDDSDTEPISNTNAVDIGSNGNANETNVIVVESEQNLDSLVELIDVDEEHDTTIDALPENGEEIIEQTPGSNQLLISSTSSLTDLGNILSDEEGSSVPANNVGNVDNMLEEISFSTAIKAIDDLINSANNETICAEATPEVSASSPIIIETNDLVSTPNEKTTTDKSKLDESLILSEEDPENDSFAIEKFDSEINEKISAETKPEVSALSSTNTETDDLVSTINDGTLIPMIQEDANDVNKTSIADPTLVEAALENDSSSSARTSCLIDDEIVNTTAHELTASTPLDEVSNKLIVADDIGKTSTVNVLDPQQKINTNDDHHNNSKSE